MKTTILFHDDASRTVSARFEDAGVVHDRPVNACYADDRYDRTATEARVADVGRGVAVKIALGVIFNVSETEPVVLDALTPMAN